jgi:hypothetical protein
MFTEKTIECRDVKLEMIRHFKWKSSLWKKENTCSGQFLRDGLGGHWEWT